MRPHRGTTARSLTVWAIVTALTAGVLALAGPVVAAALRDPDSLTDRTALPAALELLAAAAATGAVLWLWWVTSTVVVGVVRGATPRPGIGLTRALILTACGVVAMGGLPAAHAEAPGGLDGLPLPDRSTGGHRPVAGALVTAPAAPLTVRPGDSLWRLAEAHLHRRAEALPAGRRHATPSVTDADVAHYVAHLYRTNRDVIGADPDLIHPGQALDLPPTPGPAG